MNGIATDKRHYHEVDILYALGTILAILGHSHPNDWSKFPGQWVEFIYFFHMPLFFTIAGFLLASSASIKRKGYLKWISDKALRLLTPYFVLSLLALLPKYHLEHGGFTGFTPFYLLEAFFAPRQNVWGHFWFLPVLFLMYVIFGIVHNSICDAYTKWGGKLKGILLIVALVLHFVKLDVQWLGISDICDFSVYFVVGYAGFELLERKRENGHSLAFYSAMAAGLIAVSLLIWKFVVASVYRDFIISLLMIASCCAVSGALRNKKTGALDYVAKYVFTFYIYSWPAQAVIERICSGLDINWTITTPLMFIVGTLCPMMIIFVYRKCTFLHCRFIDLILGMRR